MTTRPACLVEDHWADLQRSGLNVATITTAGLHSGSKTEVETVLGFGAGTGLIIPYSVSLNGSGPTPYARVRIDNPGPDGKRYRSPKGSRNRLYVPPTLDRARLMDVTQPLVLTEGEKKSLRAVQDGLVCVGLAGVWSWRAKAGETTAPIPDLDHVPLQARDVWIVYDSDLATNPKVRAAEAALAAELRRRRARVYRVPLPGAPDGGKVGLDDYLVAHGVEAFRSIARVPFDPAEIPWPEPQPLPNDLPPVPPFDVERLLPEAFAPWVRDIAERSQAPVDYIAIAAVVAASSVIGRQLAIRPKYRDDWLVVPNLWGAAVGRAGLMKSPAMAEALKPLHRLVHEARRQHEAAMRDHEFAAEEAKAKRDLLKAQLRDALKAGQPTDDIKAQFDALDVEPPTERRYLVNDATVEKLGELLDANPNGVLVFRDELAGFLRTMDREGHENDRAFFNEAWSGTGSYTYDRIGRGTLHIGAACVSILGGIQPGPLRAYMRDVFGGGHADDGFVQRFQLITYPDVTQEWTNVDRWPNSETKTRAFEVFTQLAALPVRELAAAHEPGDIPFIRFSPEAQTAFDGWRAGLERRLRADGDDHPVVLSHLAKFRSLVPSLALVFHLIDVSDKPRGPVSLAATERALAWAGYLEAHAGRVYHAVTARVASAAQALARKIEAGKLATPFRARDVSQQDWSGLTELQDIYAAIERLCGLAWLRREAVPSTSAGGRPTSQYHINPGVVRVSRVTSGDCMVPRESEKEEEEDTFDSVARAYGGSQAPIHYSELTPETPGTPTPPTDPEHDSWTL